jgi:hypothetical protein
MNATMPFMSEQGKLAYLRDVAAAFTNIDAAQNYFPPVELEQATDQHSFAMLENAAMRTGAPVGWAPSQNDVIHAQTHLQAMSQAQESVSQGANPEEIYSYLAVAGPHVAVHLQKIAANPTRKNELKILVDQWNKSAQFTQQLEKMLQDSQQKRAEDQAKMQQAQAIQQGVDPEIQLQASKQQAELMLKKQRQDIQMQMRQEKHMQDMTIADSSTAAQIELKRLESESNRAMQFHQTKTDTDLKTASTAHDMKMKQMSAESSKPAQSTEAPSKAAEESKPTETKEHKSESGEPAKKSKKKVKFLKDKKGKIVGAEIEEE